MPPIRFRIPTIMYVVAAAAVLVTIERYLLSQPDLGVWSLILVVTQVLLFGLLVFLVPYLFRPYRTPGPSKPRPEPDPKRGGRERVG
jgi:hypothetical protein